MLNDAAALLVFIVLLDITESGYQVKRLILRMLAPRFGCGK